MADVVFYQKERKTKSREGGGPGAGSLAAQQEEASLRAMGTSLP